MAASTTADTAVPIDGRAHVRAIGERLIIPLPEEASRRLPSRGQVAVRAVMNGHAQEMVVEPDGRKGHWLPLGRELREALASGEGDLVTFSLTPTRAWPEPELPEDLAAALAGASDLDDTWRAITPMARWEWVRWIGATRNPDTRARRVDVSIDKLRGGKRRPCCFDLASCTDPELSRSGKLID